MGGEQSVWASWWAQVTPSPLAPHVPSTQPTTLGPPWRPCQESGGGTRGEEGSQGVWECPHGTHPLELPPPMELAPPSAWASKGGMRLWPLPPSAQGWWVVMGHPQGQGRSWATTKPKNCLSVGEGQGGAHATKCSRGSMEGTSGAMGHPRGKEPPCDRHVSHGTA